MKKAKKSTWKKSKQPFPLTLVLFACACCLLILSTVSGIRATLTYFSESYTAQIETADIGVTLVENGTDLSWRNYRGRDNRWNTRAGTLAANLPEQADGKIQLGRLYEEELSVRNSGKIDEYVRVRVYRSWVDDEGEKITTLSPELIDIHFLTDTWLLDESASTPERTVLYYPNILSPGQETPLFADTLRLDGSIASGVREETEIREDGTTVIRAIYAYDGMRFCLEAEVDALQTHNAQDAIRSAWGVDIAVTGGTLRLG